MKNFILGFLAMIVALACGSLGYLRLGLAELRADVNTPGWEGQLVKFAERASVRSGAAQLQNPISPTDENLIAGGKLYVNACAGCHGKPGKPPDNSPGYLPPPQFVQAGTQYSEPELFWIVKHGIRRTGMSAYGPLFDSDEQLWLLATFVKRINNLPPTVLVGIQAKKP
jgi:mono/diheme cytochrome c family protein